MPKPKKEKKEKEGVDIAEGKSPSQSLVEHFNKTFGKGSLMTLAEDNTSSVSEWLHSGSFKLDNLISNGRGLPIGKMITINGKKSSGKSTLAAHIMAEAQKLGAIAVFFDTEYAFDKVRAEQLGVDTSTLLFNQPDHIQQCFSKIESIIDVASATNSLTVIVWDSVAATPTQSEVEGEIGEGGHFGEHSKILSQGFRKLSQKVSSNRVLLFVVNQIKSNISGYGGDITYIGKNPLDFHSHVMIEIKQSGMVKEGDTIVGIESDLKISKNRVAAPFKEDKIRIRFDCGIDRAWEVLEIGKANFRAMINGSWNSILTDCLDCGMTGKIDGKRCEKCTGSGKAPDERYKNFYAKDVREYFETNPELVPYLLYGTKIK